MNEALLTDLYQLSMGAAYQEDNKNGTATFDLFIRKLPEHWGYYIANGIEEAIDQATNFSFEEEDIEYLKENTTIPETYLNSLKNFQFTGDIRAVEEGTPITPNTPILSVTAPREEAQLLESILLNTINYQTMIATKASRIVEAAGTAQVIDFGLRRAQGRDAAMNGARAAYIAGATGTSNIAAGKKYGIPIVGTMAHSHVMSYETELEAFNKFTEAFPNNTTLLIDTYDTIEGANNAVITAKNLETRQGRLGAVRLDSGDLETLSKEVRKILDENGLRQVKIVASNDLNEYKIQKLREANAPINTYGVGTELITAKPTAAIPGVYKLVEDDEGPKIKLSKNKVTYPAKKQVYRWEVSGQYIGDVLSLEEETPSHPNTSMDRPLLTLAVQNGERVRKKPSLEETRAYSLAEIKKLPDTAKQLRATPYPLYISRRLDQLVDILTEGPIAAGVYQ